MLGCVKLSTSSDPSWVIQSKRLELRSGKNGGVGNPAEKGINVVIVHGRDYHLPPAIDVGNEENMSLMPASEGVVIFDANIQGQISTAPTPSILASRIHVPMDRL